MELREKNIAPAWRISSEKREIRYPQVDSYVVVVVVNVEIVVVVSVVVDYDDVDDDDADDDENQLIT